MSTPAQMATRASSINRALDQIGDKWCLLIIEEVFWGINAFNDMMDTLGVSRGVLSERLKWLQAIDCLEKAPARRDGKRQRYYLTPKSIELYDTALMARRWEQQFYRTPALDQLPLVHDHCGQQFTPQLVCRACREALTPWAVSYAPGPGAREDLRDKKVRRRSSVPLDNPPGKRAIYRNLVNIVGDRWTANLIALTFHGLTRFSTFHRELPVATNILADRLRFLVEQGVFEQVPYQQAPLKHEYRLTAKGEALFPFFLALLQWGDKWCDPEGRGRPMALRHSCGKPLRAVATCSACDGTLRAQQVSWG